MFQNSLIYFDKKKSSFFLISFFLLIALFLIKFVVAYQGFPISLGDKEGFYPVTFNYAINNFESMKGESYNVGLEDANLSKLELCQEIKKKLPNFVYLEAPIGEDPDKRDYIVSNKKILSKGFLPSWTISRGIDELIKGYSIIKKNQFTNI